MGMAYVKIFYDWLETTAALTCEEKGRLIDAIVQYALDPEGEIFLPGNERFVFPGFVRQLERNSKNYARVCQNVSNNARAGALFKDKEKEKDKDKEQEQDREPSVPNNNNNWRVSVRARMAATQRIVNCCAQEELPCRDIPKLFEIILDAMEEGVSPEDCMDICRESNRQNLGLLLYEAMQAQGAL